MGRVGEDAGGRPVPVRGESGVGRFVMVAVRSLRGLVCAAGVALVVAGCGTGGEDAAPAVTTTTGLPIAPEAPASFDPCAIPQEILASENLVRGISDANVDGGQGIKWRGCRYVAPDSYAVGITTTNLTLGVVRDDENFVVRQEYTVDGRAAIGVTTVDEPNPRGRCIFYVEMAGGSLELSMSNPESRNKTGDLDTCGLALGLAEKVVPLIPDA
ncbi:DUF3558 domain-containing protein [Nocardia flavorosea]|uniref:DUF3558 domain-containing protein n=2 Tax=Nocardia flavorosea TaxID=53429 RepID=A0A846YJ88_9NOCA|nr:DUF3558 domain-containing protein [Nocardia flavorosea]